MIYIFSLNVILFVGMFLTFNIFRSYGYGEINADIALRRCTIVIFPIMLLAGPMFLETVMSFKLQNGGVSLDTTNWHLWLTGSGSVIGLFTFSWRLWTQRNDGSNTLSIGANVAAITIFCYMLFITIDTTVFFQNEKETGILNWKEFKKISDVKDIKCDHDTIILNDLSAESVVYRCPNNIIISELTNKPIVPWPSYTEGTSEELARALRKLQNESIKH